MARPLRVNLAGSWNHGVRRGNGGEVLFRDDTDRRRFLGLVSELPERFSLEVHAFVLMSNHDQAWKDPVRATEQLLGRSWLEMTTQYGDWAVTG